MKSACLLVLCLAAMPHAVAQRLELSAGTAADEPALTTAIPDLAARAIAVYEEPDRDRFLNTLFRLQMAAGRHAEATASIRALRELRRGKGPASAAPLFLQYEIVASAGARRKEGLTAEDALRRAFHDVFGSLDDRTALEAEFPLGANLTRFHDDLLAAMAKQKGSESISLTETIDLIRKFHVYEAYRLLLPRVPALLAENDARRYVIEKDLLVRTRDGATVAAMLVRPRNASGKLPTLFQFTIYAKDDWSYADAKKAAAWGYAGVVAYTRGKGRSPGTPVPYEHDGDDARDVIDWIAGQAWGDGRVGMYGGSYSGFTQWAVTKRLSTSLEAMATSATAAPGIDAPIQGGIFVNFMYPWLPYALNEKGLDEAAYADEGRWNKLNRTWYATGRAYRSLDTIDGRPSPIFRRWLDHPTYDAYWRRLIPFRDEFARIDIPVLATTGYFDGAQVGALYYFDEHTRRNPRANHTLLIGPYEHFAMQTGPSRVAQGYEIDPVANVDLQTLRLQWFDYVFKGREKPALLKDRVNYQVMGANEWRHARSLAGMANGSLRLHLSPSASGDTHRLSETRTKGDASVTLSVDLADRSDACAPPDEGDIERGLRALASHPLIAYGIGPMPLLFDEASASLLMRSRLFSPGIIDRHHLLMQTSRAARNLTAALAVVVWFGVLLQLRLSLHLAVANGKTVAEGIVIFLGYFTVLTNLLVGLALALPLMAPTSAPGRFFSRPAVLAGVAASISLVGITYHLLLRNLWAPKGPQLLADALLHYVVPVLYVVYWWLAVPKASLRWFHPLIWSAYPAAYLAYALARGTFLGSYPYPFIDVTAIGYPRMLMNAFALLLAYLSVGLLFVALGRASRAEGRRAR